MTKKRARYRGRSSWTGRKGAEACPKLCGPHRLSAMEGFQTRPRTSAGSVKTNSLRSLTGTICVKRPVLERTAKRNGAHSKGGAGWKSGEARSRHFFIFRQALARQTLVWIGATLAPVFSCTISQTCADRDSPRPAKSDGCRDCHRCRGWARSSHLMKGVWLVGIETYQSCARGTACHLLNQQLRPANAGRSIENQVRPHHLTAMSRSIRN